MRNILLIILSLTVLEVVGQTYTINRYPLKDATVFNLMPNANYGSSSLFVSNNILTPSSQNIFLSFDLSSIPENAIITEVELELESISGTVSELLFKCLAEDWNESLVTWATRPLENNLFDFIESPTAFSVVGPNNTYHLFDHATLKALVQYWVCNTELNFGVVIKKQGASSSNEYSSREAGASFWEPYQGGEIQVVNHRPKLMVKYVLPITVNLESTIHASTTNSGDGSITASVSGGNGVYTYQWYNSSGNAIGTNSPTISGLDYGWYGVKVTDGLGAESYMSFIVGVECGKVNIIYNPGSNYADNAYVSNYRSSTADYRDINYSPDDYLLLRRFYYSGDYAGYYDWKSMLRFRIKMDESFTINLANLKLYLTTNSGTTNNPFLRLITSNWDENSVTFNTKPSHSSSIEKSTGINSVGFKIIDTKGFWNYWKENPNYGFFLDFENPNLNLNRYSYIRSTDYAYSDYIPQIEFELSILCQYVELFSTLTGGYYQLLGDKLYVAYDEQYYTGGDNLEFSVYNTSRVEQTVPSVVTEYGDNRITFDMSGLSTGVYTLEVKGKKNRTYYLRFKKN